MPVGLLGLHSQITLVLSVTAARIAFRSTPCSAVSPTGTILPSRSRVTVPYQEKYGTGIIASSPGPMKVSATKEMSSKEPAPMTNCWGVSPVCRESSPLSSVLLPSG
ncbi:hypothetical protein D3C76_1427950 [compost metagenome]